MDAVNRFDTPATHALVRLEYGIALATCVVLFVVHIGQIHWLPAVLLFVYIDLVGYLPGAIAHHRAQHDRTQRTRIPKTYYVLYNLMHSFATQAVVVGAWVLFAGWQWALLAVPIHLLGDRALFGNALKPFAVPFEPVAHPAFTRMSRELATS
ncbi:MAG TPA: hypothetical protein VGP26_02970 [Actinophytocola sp.]|jgi:hypothetical protein|nr:hypothetical protein [Actinophytocola sp.]